MGMPETRRDWTLDEVYALPDDGNRYELIDGELFVTPAPSYVHQRVAGRLSRLLGSYADAVGIDVLMAPFEIRIEGPGEVQPDLVAFPVPTDPASTRFVDVTSLVLAVEILSPSTARVDRHRKRRLYQRNGVPEYWIVDAANRLIERWRPTDVEPDVFTDSMSWKVPAAAESLRIDLLAFFRAVYQE